MKQQFSNLKLDRIFKEKFKQGLLAVMLVITIFLIIAFLAVLVNAANQSFSVVGNRDQDGKRLELPENTTESSQDKQLGLYNFAEYELVLSQNKLGLIEFELVKGELDDLAAIISEGTCEDNTQLYKFTLNQKKYQTDVSASEITNKQTSLQLLKGSEAIGCYLIEIE